jgi:hypothetical protein
MWDQYQPTIFSHVLHCLDLPVGPSGIHMYDSKEASIGHSDGYPVGSLSALVHKGQARSKSLQLITKAAKLIVYLLRPSAARRGGEAGGGGGGGSGEEDEDETNALSHLRRLAKAVESFLHPSNGGYWTRRLTQLLSSLCHHLLGMDPPPHMTCMCPPPHMTCLHVFSSYDSLCHHILDRVKRELGMCPPPYMTCMYPPPHMTS